jgi:pimeloyl-ACP methyl ester carboxylesterase
MRIARTRFLILNPFILVAAVVTILAAGAFMPSVARADAAGQGGTGGFTASGAPHAFKSVPGVYEFVFTATRGPSPFDRIAIHRITRGVRPPAHPGLVMVYLPGTNMNGQVAIDDSRYSIPLYLAAHGVDFWALDYRTHFVPATAAQPELAELKGWTNEMFESDIDAAVRFVTAATGRERVFVAGFSRGVSFAYLFAAEHPQRVQGLVLFDGWIGHGKAGSPPPEVYAEDLGGRHLTWEKRDALLKLVLENPGAPAPLPKYKTAGENLEHVVYDSAGFGGKGGLANPFGGFSDPVVLAHVLIQYDRYWPMVQDYEDSFTPAILEALSKSKIPVMAFSSTNIAPDWPDKVAKSASSTGSSEVTVKTLKGWGHLDMICGTYARERVFAPVVQWLKRHPK